MLIPRSPAGRCSRLEGSDAADIAVVVEDAWQGRGLATRLLNGLAEGAREAGIRQFVVASHADNRRALALIQRLCPGVKPRVSHGVLRLGDGGADMNPRDAATSLRALPELAGLGQREIQSLLTHVDEVRVGPGATVARPGRPATEYVVVLAGSLESRGPAGRRRIRGARAWGGTPCGDARTARRP